MWKPNVFSSAVFKKSEFLQPRDHNTKKANRAEWCLGYARGAKSIFSKPEGEHTSAKSDFRQKKNISVLKTPALNVVIVVIYITAKWKWKRLQQSTRLEVKKHKSMPTKYDFKS